MAKTKTLVIKAIEGKEPRVERTDKWATLQESHSFVDYIDTTSGNDSASIDQFNTLVSGVPSPWAREKLTTYALADNTDRSDHRILMECYRHMRSEWRGLVAAYVLFSDRFVISEPVALVHKDIAESYGRFDIKSVLGGMLFNDAVLWKHSAEVGKSEEAAPKIQLLYYRDRNYTTNQLVGATSPQTIFFASANYSLMAARQDIYWIDDSGKFCDPTGQNFRDRFADESCRNNIKKIVSFLKNVSANRERYTAELIRIAGEGERDRILQIESRIGSFIEAWLRDIAAIDPALTQVDKGTVPVSVNGAAMPKGPLGKLLVATYTYYWYDGSFYLSNTDKPGAIEIPSAQELFIDSNYLLGFKSMVEDAEYFKQAPVTYLEAKDAATGQLYYCALPFSRFAIEKCMKLEVAQIIERSEKSTVRLDTVVKQNQLTVVLKAMISGSEVDIFSKEFTLIEPDTLSNVFAWPNFASKIWNKYYFYSEYPTNGSGIRVMPIFKSLDEEQVIDFEQVAQSDLSEEMKDMYLVKYPIGKVDTSAHRYEILRSPYPVSLLSIKVDRDDKECSAGYLMLKTNEKPMGKEAMRLINIEADSLMPASVGIDFGSTNTCAYYNAGNEEHSKAVPFTNRRLPLIGFDNGARNLAQKHELYFISNEEPINKNGQVKSWLHEHNPLYFEEAKAANELVGGVPVNETNITVKAITENEITTNAGTLCSNMKWLSDKKGVARKTSYMTTIWLQICADLFDNGNKPANLYWSYPSAMGRSDIEELKKMYKTLHIPIEGVRNPKTHSHTESEAVCSYAMTKEVALTEKRLFLGIDIGGSTSDILILGKRNGEKELFSQCSLRMAANHFFKAINSSERFRKALYKFHESKVTKIKVINIGDVVSTDEKIYSRSPYYLNNIFDQLNGGVEFSKFYNALSANVPFAFTLPAYVTGVLVFYAGMLVRSTIKRNNLEGIEQVNMRYYGKGGRTFEWIFTAYEDEARSFYKRCFQAGYGDETIRFKCDNLEDLENNVPSENKSEVAMGLVNLKENIKGIYQSDDEEETTVPTEFLSEVFGEPGFTYTDRKGQVHPIDEMDVVDGEFYHSLNNPDEFKNFFKFVDIFARFLNNTGIMDTEDVMPLKKNRSRIENVMQFFDNDKEYAKYEKALESGDEDLKPSYRMPVFIAEALYYLDKVLLPGVFRE